MIAQKHQLASSTWDPSDVEPAVDLLRSGRCSMGPKVAEFERRFADYIGTRYAVMVNSGSSANLLMVAAYTLRYGKGTVIVPAVGWATCYSPFQQYGWRLVFVDVDDSLCIDPYEAWEAKGRIQSHPTYDPDPEVHGQCIILAVNLLGNACEFARLPRVELLEDNCEALGAEYLGQKTGSFGVMSSHSFYFSHHLCTMEGGMITTDDEYFYHMLLSLRSHGWTRHLPTPNRLNATVAPFEFIYPGYNVRPTDLQGQLGLTQLDKLDAMLAIRRDNAARCPLKLPREVGKSSWFAFATPKTAALDACCETRPVVAGNFTRSASIRYYDYEIQGDLPVANEIHDHWCYIGNHSTPIDWSLLD